jgi:hypothetical protein
MSKKYVLLPILLLIGLISAELSCTGDTSPHLGSDLNINCITKQSVPLSSRCVVNVSATLPYKFIRMYPEPTYLDIANNQHPYYPSSLDGQFQVKIFIDDKTYFHGDNGSEYTANITCFDLNDNTTNSTIFTFNPSTYQSNVGWLIETEIWLQTEFPIIFFIFIAVCVIIVTGLYLLRQTGVI